MTTLRIQGSLESVDMPGLNILCRKMYKYEKPYLDPNKNHGEVNNQYVVEAQCLPTHCQKHYPSIQHVSYQI